MDATRFRESHWWRAQEMAGITPDADDRGRKAMNAFFMVAVESSCAPDVPSEVPQ